MCEEFHCLPSEAWAEWRKVPAGMLETIMLYRAYGRAKAAYDHRGKTRYEAPMTEEVMANDFALVAEELARRG